MKVLRKKILKEKLENQLAKYERRIQKMAYNAYQVRQMIEQLNAKENVDAVLNTGTQGVDGSGVPDGNTGGSQLPNNEIVDPILESESEEISVD